MKAMSVINELNSTVEVFTADEDGCFTNRIFSISTIPEDHKSNNQCADIHYSVDGMYLYASNRGHNSIVVYKVDQETMELEAIQWMKEDINWPRNFTISPDNKHLLIANQNSNKITIYTINNETGKLNYTNNSLSLSKPVCLTFLN